MGKIKVVYDCEEELGSISHQIEKFIEEKTQFNSNITSDHINEVIRKLVQDAFETGRKFQNQSGTSENKFISEIK